MKSHDTIPDPADRTRARLQWQCRRGMLELDAMLQDFMDTGYDSLSPPEQQAFAMLLKAPDQLLLDYLMGHAVPIDTEVANVAQKIRCATGP
jgi:antitoxin CptB